MTVCFTVEHALHVLFTATVVYLQKTTSYITNFPHAQCASNVVRCIFVKRENAFNAHYIYNMYITLRLRLKSQYETTGRW